MTATATRAAAGELPPPSGWPRKVPVVVSAVVVFVLVAVWVVAFSPALGARQIVVTGTHSLSSAQVRAAARIGSGAPLIRLDTAAVRKRVQALPDVASAKVSVSYPSTVRIEVTERAPVGYLVAATAGSYVLVDRTGAEYQTVASIPTGLPRFALPSGPTARATGAAVTTVAAALSAATLGQLAQISAGSPDTITLVMRDGRTVTWGSAERSAQKAALLPALLAQPGTNFDVSNPDVVVVR